MEIAELSSADLTTTTSTEADIVGRSSELRHNPAAWSRVNVSALNFRQRSQDQQTLQRFAKLGESAPRAMGNQAVSVETHDPVEVREDSSRGGISSMLRHVPHHAINHPVSVAVSNSFGFGGNNTSLVLRAVA